MTSRLQAILATHGIPTQTQKQVEPIKIRPPGDILMKVSGLVTPQILHSKNVYPTLSYT